MEYLFYYGARLSLFLKISFIVGQYMFSIVPFFPLSTPILYYKIILSEQKIEKIFL